MRFKPEEMTFTPEPATPPAGGSGVSGNHPNHIALYLRRIEELEELHESDTQTIEALDLHIKNIRDMVSGRAKTLAQGIQEAMAADAMPHNFREGVRCREMESAARAAASEVELLDRIIYRMSWK